MINGQNYFTTCYYKWTESVMKYQPHSRIANRIATVKGREVGRFEPHNESGHVELRTDMVKLHHFIELYQLLLEKNMKNLRGGYKKSANVNTIVDNLRTTLIEYKRINMTTTLRRMCIELSIKPNSRGIRQYLRFKPVRLSDKRRFKAFGGEHPISAFSGDVADKLDSLKTGESIKIGKNKYRRVK